MYKKTLFFICFTASSLFGNTAEQIKNIEPSINLDFLFNNKNIKIIGNKKNPIIHIPKGITEIREKISINSNCNGLGIVAELSQHTDDTPTKIGISILKGSEPKRTPHNYTCIKTSNSGEFHGVSHFNPERYPSTHKNYPIDNPEFFIEKSLDSDVYLKNIRLVELSSSQIKNLNALTPFNTYNSFKNLEDLNAQTKRLLFNIHSFKIEDYLAYKEPLKNDNNFVTPPWKVNKNEISLNSFSDSYSAHATIKTPIDKKAYSYAFQANIYMDYIPVSGLNQNLTISTIPVSDIYPKNQINKIHLTRITYTPHPTTINSIFKISKEYENLNNLEMIISAYNIFGKIKIKDIKIIPLTEKETNELLEISAKINPKIPEQMSLSYIMRNIKYIHGIWTSRNTTEMSKRQKGIHKLQYHLKKSDLEIKHIVEKLSTNEIYKKLEKYENIKNIKQKNENIKNENKIKELLKNTKKEPPILIKNSKIDISEITKALENIKKDVPTPSKIPEEKKVTKNLKNIKKDVPTLSKVPEEKKVTKNLKNIKKDVPTPSKVPEEKNNIEKY